MNFVKDNFQRPTGHGKDFTVELDPLPTEFKNYYQESLLAAEEIESLKQGKLYILYSGGVDSEYALRVFLALGIKITPVIIDMKEYNDYDIKYAYDLCNEKNLNPLVIDIDFDYFVTSGKFLEISKICKAELHQRAVTAYVAGELDGTVLCGDGEPYVGLNKETGRWRVAMDEHEFAVYNYYKAKGIYGTTHFNSYRPGMMAAFYTDPRVYDLAMNYCPGREGTISSKWMIYNRHSNFNMPQRIKYTGYERIERSDIFNHPDMIEQREFGKQFNGKFVADYFEFLKGHGICTPQHGHPEQITN